MTTPTFRMSHTNLLIWRDFERDLKQLNRSPRTIQSYGEAIEQLLAFAHGELCETRDENCDHDHLVDEPDLTEMTRDDIQDYLIAVLEWHSAETSAVRFRSLRRIFNWMVKEEIIEATPMRTLGEPKGEEKLTDVPAIDDVRKLLATCDTRGKKYADPRQKLNDQRDEAIIRLFCEAGAPRVAEMAGMTMEALDMVQDVVAIHGKGNKWRSVPFGAKTGKALSRYLRARKGHALVKAAQEKQVEQPDYPDVAALWLGSRGRSLTPSGIYQMIERRCDVAEIPHIHPHALRHFAVHAFYEADGTEQDAMTLFGWSSPAMAHHYAKQTAGQRAVKNARRKAIGDQL